MIQHLRPARSAGPALVLAALIAGCGAQDDSATVEPAAPSSTTSSGTEPPDPSSSAGGGTDLTVVTRAGVGGPEQTYRLACDPPAGDHPDPSAACDQLSEVGPDALAPPASDQMCTEQYGGPQTATVTGTLAGRGVQTELDRTDGCAISRWDALAAVLASDVGGPDS